MKQLPNFYSNITADVRYCEKISSTAKLIYAEITALTNKEGYCWANNGYFCKVFKLTPRTVTRLLNELEEQNFVRMPDRSGKVIRKIYLTNCKRTKMSRGVDKNVQTPPDTNVQHNTTSINTTSHTSVGSETPTSKSVIKQKKNPPNEHSVQTKPLLLDYCGKYRQKLGLEYVINWAKDGSIIKRLVSTLGEEKVKGLMDKFFKLDTDFVKNAGYSVGVFSSQIPRLQSSDVKPKWKMP